MSTLPVRGAEIGAPGGRAISGFQPVDPHRKPLPLPRPQIVSVDPSTAASARPAVLTALPAAVFAYNDGPINCTDAVRNND
jgi:hypothetical protein